MGIEDTVAPDPGGTITREAYRRANGEAPPAPLPPRQCAGCATKFQPDVYAQAYCSRRCRRANDPDSAHKPASSAEEAHALAVGLVGQLLDTPGATVVATLAVLGPGGVGGVRISVEVTAEEKGER